MYNKVPANMNFVEREKNIEKFWEDEQIFKKSIDSRKQGPTYTFYDLSLIHIFICHSSLERST